MLRLRFGLGSLVLALLAPATVACKQNPVPELSRVENEGLIRCFRNDDPELMCVVDEEVCCVPTTAKRTCESPGSCGGTQVEMACDDPFDCPDGQICCGDTKATWCAESCGGSDVEMCLTDWTCPRDEVCVENPFAQNLYWCDEPK